MLVTPLLARLLLVRIVLFFVHRDVLVVNGQIPLTDSEWEAIRLRQRLHRERRGPESATAFENPCT